MIRKLLTFIFLLFLGGCTGVPEGLTVVDDFKLDRYLGTWYEIVRTENSFEKDFEKVSATYTLRPDGKVAVLNKGVDTRSGKEKSASAKAKFAGEPDKGALLVSFFGPFYSSYNVLALDHENYSWAIVSGHDRDLLWILARTPQIDPALLDELIAKATAMGFDTSNLQRVQ